MNVVTDRASDTQRRAPTYQVLVDDIKALGVEQVFGLMSDDTAVFATALDSSGIRFYGARHENNAIAMAEGFSYATGGLGIAVIGRGPATANGLHAATYASRSGSRVLIIYGDAAVSNGAVNSMGPDYKGFNSTGVLGAAGIRTFVATSPETARGALADAAGAALQGGAAALLLPVNVQLADMDLGQGAAAAGAEAAAAARGAAPAGDRSGRRAGAAEPQAPDRRRPGRPSRRRQGGARAARRSHRRPARHLGARQGHVPRPSRQSRDRRVVLAFRRPPHDRPGRLRAGVRRRAQSPHHELRPFAAQGAADPGRCGSRPYRPLASRRCRRGGRRAGWRRRRCSRRCRPAPMPTGRSAPRRRWASCATSTSPAISRRPTRRARSIPARSARRWRSCCRPTATSSTTPATSWASCPTCPCRIRAVSS